MRFVEALPSRRDGLWEAVQTVLQTQHPGIANANQSAVQGTMFTDHLAEADDEAA